MGRYTGVIKKSATANSFGEIEANAVSGLTAFFDVAATKRAKGPGGIIKGARVSFDIDNGGRAVDIVRSLSSNDRRGRKKKWQSIPGGL